MSLRKNFAIFASALLLSPAALAVVVLQPNRVTTDMGSAGGFRAETLIDQSGLKPAYDNGVTDYKDYVDSKPEHSALANSNSWVSEKPTGFIEFDLGGPFILANIALWSGTTNAILGSLDGFEVWIGKILVGSFNAKNDDPIAVQSFDLKLVPATSLVRLIVLSNGNKRNTVISEVAFGGTAATVPEPATVVLVGVFLAGLSFRKKRLN